MEKILVPVDLTEVSFNALEYCLNLYDEESDITIFHVAGGVLDLKEPISLEHGISKETAISEDINDLILNVMNLETLPENCTIKIASGEPVSSIAREAASGHYTQIVMGTRDKYDFFDKWIGTITLGVVKTAQCPILLVPRYSRYRGLKKIMVASDYHLTNPVLVSKLRSWNKKHKAFIKFLHIQTAPSDSFESESETLIRELFEKKEPDFGFEIAVFREKQIAESLLASAYNFHADALIVLPDNQNFVSSILFKNVSKDLILKSSIPILFITS